MITPNRIHPVDLPVSWREKVATFERRFHCRVAFHDPRGALSLLTAPEALPLHHDWRRCEKVRSRSGESYANCVNCDTVQLTELCRAGRPFRKTCHAGFEELVYPIHCLGVLAAVMFAGDFGGGEKIPDDLPFWGHLLAEEFRRGLENLPGGRIRRTEAEQIRLWLVHNFRNPEVSLGTLAEFLGVSRSRTSQLLARHFSKGFPALLHEYRIECATQMLENSRLPLAEIARLAGFRSANYLHRRFRTAQGMTPEEYRSARRS